MNTAVAIQTTPEFPIAFRPLTRRFLAKLRYLIELSAAPYLVMGSRYL